jgi:hypothetical protein
MGVPSPGDIDVPDRAHNVRAVLRARGFRRLLGVRLISQLSDGWFQAGLAGSVLFNPEKGAGPLAIAFGFAVLLLPYSVVGPYVGVFLDRWSRRSILFVANMIRALLVAPTALLIFAGTENLGFLLLAFLIIAINRFFTAGISAAIPHVVDDRRLVTANSMASTLGTVCFSIGLGSAAFTVTQTLEANFHGYGVISSLAVIGYGCSALMARLSFAPDALGPDVPATVGMRAALATSMRGMVAGVRHLTAQRGAAYALLAQSAHRFLVGILGLAILLLYRGPFAGGGDVTGSIPGLALAFAVGGFGVLLASILTPPAARGIGGWRWLTLLLAASGVAIGVFGPPFVPPLLLIAVLVVALAGQGIKIIVDTDLQHECADEFRGRVFSLADTTFNGSFVLGTLLAAFVLPPDGKSIEVLLAVAIGFVAIAVWYGVVGGRWAKQVGDDIRDSAGAEPPTRDVPYVRAGT